MDIDLCARCWPRRDMLISFFFCKALVVVEVVAVHNFFKKETTRW